MTARRIVDRIAECDDGNHRMRPGEPIQGVTLHMFAVLDIHDAAGIARFFRDNPEWTGGQMSYTYCIQPSGLIELALPILEMGPHAMRWSLPTIGVVCLGDFNKHTPPPPQWNACVDLVAEIGLALGTSDIRGHTERPNATRYPRKNCPGKLFDLDVFRAQVRQIQSDAAIQRLETAVVRAA